MYLHYFNILLKFNFFFLKKVQCCKFKENKDLLATCCFDKKVRIFNLNGTCLHTLNGHSNTVGFKFYFYFIYFFYLKKKG